METAMYDLKVETTPTGRKKSLKLKELKYLAQCLMELQKNIDFHMGARAWCYILEQKRIIDKDNFDWAQKQIKKVRLAGFLKPGFIKEESGHEVSISLRYTESPEDYFNDELYKYRSAESIFQNSYLDYTYVDFWKDQDYFIQLLVEKESLKSLFTKICKKYNINFANLRGSGSMEQKAVMAEYFNYYEKIGKKCVLLTCGDHDPPGLNISKVLKKQFTEYSKFSGWDPKNLIVERIGINYDFIMENKLTWVNNLISGNSKTSLADPKHEFYKKNTYDIKGYIKKYGVRKCESESIVIVPEIGRKLLTDTLDKYLGINAYKKYYKEIMEKQEKIKKLIENELI